MTRSDSVKPPACEPDPELLLLHRAQSGDFEAFTKILLRYQSRVYGMAMRMLHAPADAEDVVQQTFLSLIEHIKTFRGESKLATWILRIAANHALKLLRKRRGLPMQSLDREDDDGPLPHPDYIASWKETPPEMALRAEFREVLDQALEELDEKYRVVFVLRDIEELSVSETAEILGISEANVKVRLLRARLQLRERMTRIFGDEATRLFPSHDHG